MFPSLSDLIAYFFHIHILLPIQTFGLFVALSFLFSYLVFRSEFKRKEADKLIFAFTETEVIGLPPSVFEIAINALLGGVFGYKILGALINYHFFVADPMNYIFSVEGNLIAGVVSAFVFAVWIYTDRKRAEFSTPRIMQKKVHPYQLTTYLVFALAFWGFIGAKLFDTVEHFQTFLYRPLDTLFARNGFTFYGGLAFGALAYLYICNRKGMKLVHLSDIGSPGMMLAYGIGRMGCQLSGDGDWGVPNLHIKPNWLNWLPDWAWSYRYPHNVIDAGRPMYGCIGEHCNQLLVGVYPTSLYESIICLLLFAFLWLIRKRIHTPGLMFSIYFMMNGAERIWIERIRVTEMHHFLGVYFTQAQLVGLVFLLGGISEIFYIIIKKYKNATATHYVNIR